METARLRLDAFSKKARRYEEREKERDEVEMLVSQFPDEAWSFFESREDLMMGSKSMYCKMFL